MRILRSLAASALAASLVVPSVARAGQDEEIFALGALAGIGATILIGGVAATVDRLTTPDPVVVDTGDRHIAYCSNRYRTYRVSDNTFQPNHGPRRACVSPFLN